MKTPNTVKDIITRRIDSSVRDVFMRKDFEDVASYTQVGRSLKELVEKGKIVKIGHGIYAKAAFSPLSKRIVPRRGLRELATEALKNLEIEVVASSYDQAYTQGRTTQVPTGRVVGVKERVSRKIGYDGKYVAFEYIS
jgi:hypothetical protein